MEFLSRLIPRDMIPKGRHAHVDGLRAIAVVAVVLFHAGLPGFSGGFVGVDVFFVISGYLILTQIIIELEENRFSLMDFWARRIARIVPALLVVVAVTFLAGLVLLHAHREWETMTLSSSTAALFISNLYFFVKQGYFDSDAWAKPLLHTWSLGVEQQFYLLAPLLLMPIYARFAKPRPVVIALAVGLAVLSLVLTIVQTPSDPDHRNAPFYLTPYRAWAFILGGFAAYAAWHLKDKFRTGATLQTLGGLLSFSGVALIFAAVMLIPETARHPGWVAIIPVSGTMLAILGGLIAPGATTNRVLSLPPMVFVGVISYGWYLWHWPLMSLGQINAFGSFSLERNLIMAAIAFGLAILSWVLIERPAMQFWRARPKPRPALKLVAQALAIGVLLAAFTGSVGGWRYGEAKDHVAVQGQEALLGTVPARQCANLQDCGIAGTGLLVGDSHADRLLDALTGLGSQQGINIIWPVKPVDPRFADPDTVGQRVEEFLADLGPAARTADFAIVVYRLAAKMQSLDPRLPPDTGFDLQRAFMKGQVQALSDNGRRRILLVAPVIDFDRSIPECPLRAEAKGLGWDHCAMARAEVEAYRQRAMDLLRDIFANTPNARLLDPLDLFCNDESCTSWVDQSLLYSDDNHLSPFGADYFIRHYAGDMLWAMTGNDVRPDQLAE